MPNLNTNICIGCGKDISTLVDSEEFDKSAFVIHMNNDIKNGPICGDCLAVCKNKKGHKRNMYYLEKDFWIEGAHSLPQMPPGHPCANLHGHSWKIKIVVKARKLNEHGFVMDFSELKKRYQWVIETFDHKLLNDTVEVPTCENISKWIFDGMTTQMVEDVKMHSVEVEETRGNRCIYMEDGF